VGTIAQIINGKSFAYGLKTAKLVMQTPKPKYYRAV